MSKNQNVLLENYYYLLEIRTKICFTTVSLMTLWASIIYFFIRNFWDDWLLFCAGWWKMSSENII